MKPCQLIGDTSLCSAHREHYGETDVLAFLLEYRGILEDVLAIAEVSYDGDPWFSDVANLDTDATFRRARATIKAFDEVVADRSS